MDVTDILPIKLQPPLDAYG